MSSNFDGGCGSSASASELGDGDIDIDTLISEDEESSGDPEVVNAKRQISEKAVDSALGNLLPDEEGPKKKKRKTKPPVDHVGTFRIQHQAGARSSAAHAEGMIRLVRCGREVAAATAVPGRRPNFLEVTESFLPSACPLIEHDIVVRVGGDSKKPVAQRVVMCRPTRGDARLWNSFVVKSADKKRSKWKWPETFASATDFPEHLRSLFKPLLRSRSYFAILPHFGQKALDLLTDLQCYRIYHGFYKKQDPRFFLMAAMDQKFPSSVLAVTPKVPPGDPAMVAAQRIFSWALDRFNLTASCVLPVECPRQIAGVLGPGGWHGGCDMLRKWDLLTEPRSGVERLAAHNGGLTMFDDTELLGLAGHWVTDQERTLRFHDFASWHGDVDDAVKRVCKSPPTEAAASSDATTDGSGSGDGDTAETEASGESGNGDTESEKTLVILPGTTTAAYTEANLLGNCLIVAFGQLLDWEIGEFEHVVIARAERASFEDLISVLKLTSIKRLDIFGDRHHVMGRGLADSPLHGFALLCHVFAATASFASEGWPNSLQWHMSAANQILRGRLANRPSPHFAVNGINLTWNAIRTMVRTGIPAGPAPDTLVVCSTRAIMRSAEQVFLGEDVEHGLLNSGRKSQIIDHTTGLVGRIQNFTTPQYRGDALVLDVAKPSRRTVTTTPLCLPGGKARERLNLLHLDTMLRCMATPCAKLFLLVDQDTPRRDMVAMLKFALDKVTVVFVPGTPADKRALAALPLERPNPVF